jgi:hypothetical protein
MDEPYEIIDRIPLERGYDLQIRLDLNRDGFPDHLNQDITNLPRRISIDILQDDHYKPL